VRVDTDLSAPDAVQSLEQLLAAAPIEVIENLARRHFTASALSRRRLAERNAAIRMLAIGRTGTGREIARALHRELRRYGAAAYRFERDRAPADPGRAPMHRVLTLNDGNAPSEPTLRRALAGLGGSKKRPAMIQHTR